MTLRKWIDCECTHPEHAVRVSLLKTGPNSTDVELILEPRVSLARIGFFYRLWYAIKLIFGCQPNMYAETIMSDDQVDALAKVITSYRLLRKLRKAKENKGRSSR